MTQATSRVRRMMLGVVAGAFAISAIGSTAGLVTSASASTVHKVHHVQVTRVHQNPAWGS
jgi:hypothetical protein